MVAISCAVASGIVAGCSASVSVVRTVSGSAIAKEGASLFTQQFHAKFTMSCPHGVSAKKGATTRCVTTNPAGTRFGTTVTVTSVKGSDVQFHFQNDSTPMK